MARFVQPTPEQERGWKEWVASRPPIVRVIAERFEPWSLYRMKSTDQVVNVVGFSEGVENGTVTVTVTVNVSGDFNLVLHERTVFGIAPDDLEPCDVPDPDEVTGALLSAADVVENLDGLRVAVRPDLWDMGPDGKARRRDN